jgi:hypothetical protein
MGDAHLTELQKDAEKYHRLTDKLRATEQRNRILSLIRNGATGEQVSEILAKGDPERGIEPVHMDPRTVNATVRKYLERVHTEDSLTIEQLRVLENERLDAIWAKLSQQVINQDGSVNVKIVDRLTRLSERRAKMNGLDAAQRIEHHIGDGLAALGIESEHIERAKQAFVESFEARGIPDVEVVEEETLVGLPETAQS